MRTVTFDSVWKGAARKLGLDPDYLLDSTKAALVEHVNARVRSAWTAFEWPELVALTAMRYRDEWDSGLVYAPGDQVWWGEDYYQCIDGITGTAPSDLLDWLPVSSIPTSAAVYDSATTYAVGDTVAYADDIYYCITACTGENPASGYAYWTRLVPFIKSIALDDIGEVYEVWSADPRSNRRPLTVAYTIGPAGIVVDAAAGDRVWVEYSVRPPVFTLTAWSASTSYVAGDLAYLAPNTYKASAAVSGSSPDASSSWGIEEMPYVLAEIIKHGIVADGLREDGQHEKAALEDQRADVLLENEICNITTRQHQRATYGPRNDK